MRKSCVNFQETLARPNCSASKCFSQAQLFCVHFLKNNFSDKNGGQVTRDGRHDDIHIDFAIHAQYSWWKFAPNKTERWRVEAWEAGDTNFQIHSAMSYAFKRDQAEDDGLMDGSVQSSPSNPFKPGARCFSAVDDRWLRLGGCFTRSPP